MRRWSDHEDPTLIEEGATNERKLVTVLFADVVNSTGLAETLDPDDYHGALTALFRRVAGALRDHGAYVEKYVGDSVMAVFGAPTTAADDAIRALRAGEVAHQVARRFADEWAARLGRRIELRVGINSGMVIAGRVGEGRAMDYGVLGEVVSVAARLQAAAEPGQTLVGEATRALVGDGFAFALLPPLLVAGKSRPVHAFRLRAERGAGPGDRRFVGRDVELDVLCEAVAAVAGGGRARVAVVGEGGTGKTALLEAARSTAAGRVRWIQLTGGSHLRDRPLVALGALIREQAPNIFRPSRSSDLGQLVSPVDSCRALAARAGLSDDPWGAAVVDFLGGFGAGLAPWLDELRSAERRGVVFDRATRILDAILGAPAILALDDAQGLDDESVRAARSVLDRRGPRGALGCIAAFRPGADFPGNPDVVIALGPLGRAEGLALAGSLLPATAEPGLVEGLWRSAKGNPRLLVELAKAWSPDQPPGNPRLAPSLQAFLLAELDRLPEEARQVARVAAVAEPEIVPDGLAAMLRDSRVDLPRALAALAAARVVEPIEGGYRFSVPVFAEMARASLLLVERRGLHVLLAEWLRVHRPDDLAAISRHFEAGDDARAAEPLRRLGDRYRARGDFAAAADGYRRALRWVERGGSSDLRSRLTLADALASLGHVVEALSALGRARAEAETAAASAAVAARLARWWLVLEDPDETRRAIEAAESMGPDDPGLTGLEVARIELLVREGRAEEAIGRARATLARGDFSRCDADVPLRRLHHAIVRAHLARGETSEARAHLGRPGAWDGETESQLLRAFFHVRAREDDEAAKQLVVAERLARERGERPWQAVARELRAELAARRGEFARAAELARSAEVVYGDLGNWRGVERCRSLASAPSPRHDS